MKCPECGTAGEGRYCSQCGARLSSAERRCAECGSDLAPEDRYCSGCGTPVGRRLRKPARAYLPWILTGAVLVVFAVAVALLVEGEATPREEGMPPTGTVIRGSDGSDAPGASEAPGASGSSPGAMPSAGDLAEMSAREAADRLFDRTMRELQAGAQERARFFAGMGRRAYARVPRAEFDADARFHVGLLALVEGDSGTARAQADSILASRPAHLLGLLLAERAAATAEARRQWRQRFLTASDTVGLASDPAYAAHRSLIEAARDSLGGPGR